MHSLLFLSSYLIHCVSVSTDRLFCLIFLSFSLSLSLSLLSLSLHPPLIHCTCPHIHIHIHIHTYSHTHRRSRSSTCMTTWPRTTGFRSSASGSGRSSGLSALGTHAAMQLCSYAALSVACKLNAKSWQPLAPSKQFLTLTPRFFECLFFRVCSQELFYGTCTRLL